MSIPSKSPPGDVKEAPWNLVNVCAPREVKVGDQNVNNKKKMFSEGVNS